MTTFVRTYGVGFWDWKAALAAKAASIVGYVPMSAPRMPGASDRVSIRPMVAVFRSFISLGITDEFGLEIPERSSGVDFSAGCLDEPSRVYARFAREIPA